MRTPAIPNISIQIRGAPARPDFENIEPSARWRDKEVGMGLEARKSARERTMPSTRFSLGFFLFGLFIAAFCGSAMGSQIGLRGLAQWSIAGFAMGIVFASAGISGATFRRLSDRVRELENRIGGDKST